MLGDNSAQSSDGRLWVGEWWVERELLIGKALFIYWPHGWEMPYLPLALQSRSLLPENAPRPITFSLAEREADFEERFPCLKSKDW